jgi:hypothetical protein
MMTFAIGFACGALALVVAVIVAAMIYLHRYGFPFP